MEDAAISVTQFLVRLIFPFVILGSLAGLGLMAGGIVIVARDSEGRPVRPSPQTGPKTFASERITVGICACLGTLGLAALIVNTARRVAPPNGWSVLLVALFILLGAPALFWKSRWRVFMEGLAAVALAGVSFLSGFSIGFAFVPLLAVMIWVSLRHLLRASRRGLLDARRSG